MIFINMREYARDISFKNILIRLLTEELTFRQLLRASDKNRIRRANYVKNDSKGAEPLIVNSARIGEMWKFSYKSKYPHSTTGRKFLGYIKLLREKKTAGNNTNDLNCKVHCSCPDYFYRWEYNNVKADAGDFCKAHNQQPPKPQPYGVGELGVGLCKHLISLGSVLESKLDPQAPTPEDQPPSPDIEKRDADVQEKKLFYKINRLLSNHGFPVLDDLKQLKDFHTNAAIHTLVQLDDKTKEVNTITSQIENLTNKIQAISSDPTKANEINKLNIELKKLNDTLNKLNRQIETANNTILSIIRKIQRTNPSQNPLTVNAPEPDTPDTSYSDTRSGLTENIDDLCKKLDDFVMKNPTFEI